MPEFEVGQRVIVKDGSHPSVRDHGVVKRIKPNGDAWVEMNGDIHVDHRRFSIGDERAKWIELRFDQCQVVEQPRSEPSPCEPNLPAEPVANLWPDAIPHIGFIPHDENTFEVTQIKEGRFTIDVQCDSGIEGRQMLYRVLRAILGGEKQYFNKLTVETFRGPGR